MIGFAGLRLYLPMDAAPQPSPEEIAALRAALAVAEERGLRSEAELAVARARASDDLALIAHQKLRIAKLERQLYGQRSERQAQLIDQMELELEEHGASASADELAAELAAARTTQVLSLRPPPAGDADHLPRAPAQGARGRRSTVRLRVLRERQAAQAR